MIYVFKKYQLINIFEFCGLLKNIRKSSKNIRVPGCEKT